MTFSSRAASALLLAYFLGFITDKGRLLVCTSTTADQKSEKDRLLVWSTVVAFIICQLMMMQGGTEMVGGKVLASSHSNVTSSTSLSSIVCSKCILCHTTTAVQFPETHTAGSLF